VYHTGGRISQVSDRDIGVAVRWGATWDNLISKGYTLNRVSSHSLWAGGAMAMKLSGASDSTIMRVWSVGNLPEGYIHNVPLLQVPRDQSTFQSRVPTVNVIPVYYKETYVIPTYNSTCRTGERVATANSPQWHPIAINT